MTVALLACADLVIGYNGHPVAEGLSFSVNAGDYLCILGENGAGKSTLIRTLLHLQPVLSGNIAWGDGLKPTEIGYLPQQTDVQRDFPATAKEIVLSGCLNGLGPRFFYNAAEKKRALDNLDRMGIAHLAKRCYRELSGGQQQRVLLARALCATKKLILLDEPVAGLDPAAARDMYALIRKLNREEGISVIMVSHDLTATLEDATHALHLTRKGAFFGDKETYLRSDAGRLFLAMAEGGDEHVQ